MSLFGRYDSFTGLPKDIRFALMMRMDLLTLMALMATCRKLRKKRNCSKLWRELIVADFGYADTVLDCALCAPLGQAVAIDYGRCLLGSDCLGHCPHNEAQENCDIVFYQRLVLRRWSLARFLVHDLTRSWRTCVYGGFVRDLFSTPLFRDIDVWVNGKSGDRITPVPVQDVVLCYANDVVAAGELFTEAVRLSLDRGVGVELTRLAPRQACAAAGGGYNMEVRPYRVRTRDFPRVGVTVEFVFGGPLVRDADLDVNSFCLIRDHRKGATERSAFSSALNLHYTEQPLLLAAWGKQLATCITEKGRSPFSTGPRWIDADNPKRLFPALGVDHPALRVLQRWVSEIPDWTVFNVRVKETLTAASRRLLMPALPAVGTYVTVVDSETARVDASFLRGAYTPALPLYMQDPQLRKNAARLCTMLHRGWRLAERPQLDVLTTGRTETHRYAACLLATTLMHQVARCGAVAEQLEKQRQRTRKRERVSAFLAEQCSDAMLQEAKRLCVEEEQK